MWGEQIDLFLALGKGRGGERPAGWRAEAGQQTHLSLPASAPLPSPPSKPSMDIRIYTSCCARLYRCFLLCTRPCIQIFVISCLLIGNLYIWGHKERKVRKKVLSHCINLSKCWFDVSTPLLLKPWYAWLQREFDAQEMKNPRKSRPPKLDINGSRDSTFTWILHMVTTSPNQQTNIFIRKQIIWYVN